LAIFNEA